MDFANRNALKELTRSILKQECHITYWDVPDDYLVPCYTMRLHYLQWVASLLNPAKTSSAHILDIGTGASCIFPLMGHGLYGWSFVGSEIDERAIEHAQKLIEGNKLPKWIEVRRQPEPKEVLNNIINGEKFDAVICNPPFYHATEERKFKSSVPINVHEETTEGGELGFVQRLLKDSLANRTNVAWYTSLLGKKIDCDYMQRYIRHFVPDVKRSLWTALDQGRNRRWAIAWTFLDPH